MSEGTTNFGAIGIGERFHFDRGIESGMLAHLRQPGLRVYVKRSARTYTDDQGQTHRVGSVLASAWRP